MRRMIRREGEQVSRKSAAVDRSALAVHWDLDRDVVFLNHGSFGACPIAIQEKQAAVRRRMERQPVRFFEKELPSLMHEARVRTARFLGADPDGLVFVSNATDISGFAHPREPACCGAGGIAVRIPGPCA